MMNRRQLLTNSMAGVAAVVAANAIPTRAQADSNSHNLIGSWLGIITATNPPLGQFNDLISFLPGGIVTESRRYSVPGTPLGNLLETTGHGAWERRSVNTFEAFFRFLLQKNDTDTAVALGTDNIRLSLTLDRETGTLSGTFESQIKDTTDFILLTVTGDYSATSITV
jgi:hypothetical protein